MVRYCPVAALFLFGTALLTAQQTPQAQLPPSERPGVLAPGKTEEGEDKRAYGVLPNYRTAEMKAIGHPLSPGQKMSIAAKDSFDYPLALLSGAFAGLYQLEDNHPQFGQGVKGYFKRLGTSYTDQMTGNLLTEGILPSLLKEDPRYFRMASGTFGHRLTYALTRVLVTRTDAGARAPNVSEILGNGMSAAIGLSYYEDNRNFEDFAQNWGVAIATDAISQVGKEFWPDVKRHFFQRRHH